MSEGNLRDAIETTSLKLDHHNKAIIATLADIARDDDGETLRQFLEYFITDDIGIKLSGRATKEESHILRVAVAIGLEQMRQLFAHDVPSVLPNTPPPKHTSLAVLNSPSYAINSEAVGLMNLALQEIRTLLLYPNDTKETFTRSLSILQEISLYAEKRNRSVADLMKDLPPNTPSENN